MDILQARWILLVSAAAATLMTVPASALDMVKRDGVWAQTYVGRAADPAVTFGQLPNGMRYAIKRNNTPSGQMAVRLLIGSGSLAEPDGNEGIAHFVEHMAFRGSTHVADGELSRILQRQGLAFGPDTNATTTQEATVYQFDFPKSDAASLDSALMLMRETASELRFPQAAVDAERGVVMAEERERDSPAFEAQKALLNFTLEGQLAPRRWPIGSIEIIAHAQPATLRQFYAANYRPDNATLVVVGDVDPAAVEAQIKARFGDWKVAEPRQTVNTGSVEQRGEQVRLFSKPGAPQLVQVTWTRPFDLTADTEARERRDVIRALATVILNRRLQELAQQPSPPFIGAGFNRANGLRSANLTTLIAVTAPDKWQQGLAAVVVEQRRITRDGITQAQLDQAEAQLTVYFTNAAVRDGTRTSPTIANSLVKAASENSLFTSAAQDLDSYRAYTKTIMIAEVNAAIRDAFTGEGPLIFASSSQPLEGGDAALREAFDSANAAPIDALKSAGTIVWPYSSFGPASSVVARQTTDDLGVTVVRFANGNTLTIKPTTFAKDEILIDAEFGHGRSGLPAGLERAYWMVTGPGQSFLQGGTAKLSTTEITNLLASRVTAVELTTNDSAYILAGRTRLQDLDIELQLMAAFLTDPAYRPEAVTRTQTALATALSQIEASPAAVLQRNEARLLHGGDPRWSSIPSAADLAASRPDDLRAILQPELRAGPVHLTIVGDVTIDAAIQASATTIGAIAGKAEAPPPVMVSVRFPVTPTSPVILSHTGRPDQAIAVDAWPTEGFWGHEHDSRAMTVAMQIIQARLFDRLRAADGATYSPAAESDFSFEFADYGVATIRVAAAPAKLAEFEAEVRNVIADLSAREVADDELTRAKQPLIERRLRDRQTNSYWLGTLSDSEREPRSFTLIRERVAALQAVTAAEVRRVCGRYLASRPYRLIVELVGR